MTSDCKRIITNADRRRLGGLVTSDEARAISTPDLLDELEWKLEQAASAEPESVPGDVITMNSTVRLVELSTATHITCKVVYPKDVGAAANGKSVLGPMGGALLGCRVGDLVECDGIAHCHRWRVDEVIYQPERAGAFDL